MLGVDVSSINVHSRAAFYFAKMPKIKVKKGIIFIMWQHYSPFFLKISPIFFYPKNIPHILDEKTFKRE
jgi:hypothetical protein